MATKPKVTISYCAECGYEPQTLALAGALMKALGYRLAAIELVPWHDGAFDVLVGGELVHSMLRDGGFPEHAAVIAAVRERLAPRTRDGYDRLPRPAPRDAVDHAVISRDGRTPGGRMDHETRFWRHAEPLLSRTGVARGTMMGFPCLRVDGKFFASFDRKEGNLLVKLPAERVAALVAADRGESFSPAGRTFREWVAIRPADEAGWPGFLEEALGFVGG